jgi:hypothetical protein
MSDHQEAKRFAKALLILSGGAEADLTDDEVEFVDAAVDDAEAFLATEADDE